jgi:hypothetical protein
LARATNGEGKQSAGRISRLEPVGKTDSAATDQRWLSAFPCLFPQMTWIQHDSAAALPNANNQHFSRKTYIANTRDAN